MITIPVIAQEESPININIKILVAKLMVWEDSGYISEVELANAVSYLMKNKILIPDNMDYALQLQDITHKSMKNPAALRNIIEDFHEPINTCRNELNKKNNIQNITVYTYLSCYKTAKVSVFDPTTSPFVSSQHKLNVEIPKDWREWCDFPMYEDEAFCSIPGKYQHEVHTFCSKRFPHIMAIINSPPGGWVGDPCFDWVLSKLNSDWYN